MDEHDLDRALRRIAQHQHQLVSRAQARDLGASDRAIRRRLASPEWEALSPRVLRLVGSSETFEQRCTAGALDAGPRAVVSHESAARLWGLPGFGAGGIHVSRPRGGTRRPVTLATVHEPRALAGRDLSFVAGVPVTTAARTLFDLAAGIRPGRLERAVDNALARNLTTVQLLRAVTDDLARHGRGGSTVMRAVLLERGADFVPPASGLESRFLTLLRRAGFPEPRRQVDLGGDQWVGRVDFYYPDRRLVIEVDSAIHHGAALDRAADRRRDDSLHAAGYRVLRVTDELVWQRPDEALARVRAAFAASAA